MQAQLVLYIGILLYTGLATIGLVLFDAGALTTALVVLGAPLAVWSYELHPSRGLVLSVGLIALATALLFETIAHTSGLWLSVSSLTYRVFGLFPIEALLYSTLLYFYVVFFHEFLVDDKKLYRVIFDRKRGWLLTALVGLAFSIVLLVLLSGQFVIPYAFTLLLIGMIVALVVAALYSHHSPWRVLHKALLTTSLLLPVMVLLETIAIFNVHTVFANPMQYLFTIELLGEMIPVEQVLYMLLAPVWVVTIYELYFDDAA
jgi:hypothetical protein